MGEKVKFVFSQFCKLEVEDEVFAGLVPPEVPERVCSVPVTLLLVFCFPGLIETTPWSLPSSSHAVLFVCVHLCPEICFS